MLQQLGAAKSGAKMAAKRLSYLLLRSHNRCSNVLLVLRKPFMELRDAAPIFIWVWNPREEMLLPKMNQECCEVMEAV